MAPCSSPLFVPSGQNQIMDGPFVVPFCCSFCCSSSLDDASLALAASLDGGLLQRHAAWAVDQAFSDGDLCLGLPA
jgi:hypothetical protein